MVEFLVSFVRNLWNILIALSVLATLTGISYFGLINSDEEERNRIAHEKSMQSLDFKVTQTKAIVSEIYEKNNIGAESKKEITVRLNQIDSNQKISERDTKDSSETDSKKLHQAYKFFLNDAVSCVYGSHDFTITNEKDAIIFLDGDESQNDTLRVHCYYTETDAVYEGYFNISRKYDDNKYMYVFKVGFIGVDVGLKSRINDFINNRRDCERLRDWFFFDRSGNVINLYQLN
jgi:hypothetical protein